MKTLSVLAVVSTLLIPTTIGAATAPQTQFNTAAVLKAEFIFEEAPFPSCHASTIVETRTDLLAAWFGGTREKHPDVGIWTSRNHGGRWSAPKEVANGIQPDGRTRHPCWNPVLFQPSTGPLLLFYKVGPSPEAWWGMLMTSTNQGESWSKPKRLADGFLGPVRNKPIELEDGSLLCGSSTEDAGWRVHMERAYSLGDVWNKTEPLNKAADFAAIQPTILVHDAKQIQILCRSKQKVIVESWSKDAGKTWSPMTRSTLPNPDSGIDAVQLRTGGSLLVYNPTTSGRSPLSVAHSKSGKEWHPVLTLESEPGEYSYPAIIQSSDGLVHITYTWKRKLIKHVVVDPRRIKF